MYHFSAMNFANCRPIIWGWQGTCLSDDKTEKCSLWDRWAWHMRKPKFTNKSPDRNKSESPMTNDAQSLAGHFQTTASTNQHWRASCIARRESLRICYVRPIRRPKNLPCPRTLVWSSLAAPTCLLALRRSSPPGQMHLWPNNAPRGNRDDTYGQ